MYKVTEQNSLEVETHIFAAEASELGLPPGYFPTRLPTDLGNGEDFLMIRYDGDGALRYMQMNGCISLVVFND